ILPPVVDAADARLGRDVPEDTLRRSIVAASPFGELRAHRPAYVVQRPVRHAAHLVEFDLVLSPRTERPARSSSEKILGISNAWDRCELRMDQIRQYQLTTLLLAPDLSRKRNRLWRNVRSLESAHFPAPHCRVDAD